MIVHAEWLFKRVPTVMDRDEIESLKWNLDMENNMSKEEERAWLYAMGIVARDERFRRKPGFPRFLHMIPLRTEIVRFDSLGRRR